jgi:hypothetical protein
MGLQFEAIDAKQLLSLRKWIRELSGETSAEPATDPKWDSPARVTAENSVLNDLIIELMRKDVLAEATGRGMLQRLASAA